MQKKQSNDREQVIIQPPTEASEVEPVLEVPEIERVENEMPGGFKPAGGLADKIVPPRFHLPGHKPNDH